MSAEDALCPRRDDPSVLVLHDEHDAPRHARRYVGGQLRDAGLGHLADDAGLVVTELVTNAMLHAGLPADVLVHLDGDRVRIEVGDRSPAVPLPTVRSSDAMTGRGLAVVEALADTWGVEAREDGKVVWVELSGGPGGGGGELSDDELLAMWAGASASDEPERQPRYTVRLGEVPTDLLLSAKSHVDNLVREFALAARGADSGATAAVTGHIAALVDDVVNRFAEARHEIKRQALAAAHRGDTDVRLELRLPLSAAEAGERYLAALDEADAYCRAARLLTLESPPQHRLFRHWYVGELIAQLRAAAGMTPARPTQTLAQRLLQELDQVSAARHAADRSARLAGLSSALSGALTPEAVAQAVLTDGVAALGASGGGVLLIGDQPTLSVTGTLGYDETTVERLRHEPRDAELPAAVAARTRASVWLESVDERDRRFPQLAGFEPGTVSMCAVPLVVGTRCLGALRFSFTRTRLFDDAERRFVLAMAAQTAQALDRAQLYEQRLDIAARLQRSLHPPSLPAVPGLQFTAAYRAADGTEVGGDFYDVWPVGDERWCFAIGDVSGSGPEAAAVTGLVRHTLRALTLAGFSPAAVLERVNGALLTADPYADECFCTVLLGALTNTGERCHVTLVGGGHPGPLLVRSDGATEDLQVGGALLGAFEDVEIAQRSYVLDPGDELVLYTDGVVDARDDGRWFGTDGVAEAARSAQVSDASTAAAVRHAVERHVRGRTQDDLAVLALRYYGNGHGHGGAA